MAFWPPEPPPTPDPDCRCASAQQRPHCPSEWANAQLAYQQTNCSCQVGPPNQPTQFQGLHCLCGGDTVQQFQGLHCLCGGDTVQQYQPPCPNNAYCVCPEDLSPVFSQTQCVCQEYREPDSCENNGTEEQWNSGTNPPCPGFCQTEYQTQYCSGACVQPEQNQICPCCGNSTLSPSPQPANFTPRCPCPEETTTRRSKGCSCYAPLNQSGGNCSGARKSAPIVIPCYPVCPGGCAPPFNQGGEPAFSLSTSPMAGVTVYSASYKPMVPAACRASPVRPRNNLCTPGAIPMPCGCSPIGFCPSPPPPQQCAPRDNLGAVTPALPCPMASLTINRASYQPIPVTPRTTCPWLPIQGYTYPWPPLDATTVYGASYMPPGCNTPAGFVPTRPATCTVPVRFTS